MGLYAQKILTVFAMPLGASVVLLAAGLALLAIGRRRLGPAVLGTGLGLLWLASMPPMAESLLASLEDDFPPGQVEGGPDAGAIVVLGGALSTPRAPWFVAGLVDSSDRILHAARLFRAGRAPRIVISGGSIPWMTSGGAEAYPVAALLEEWGVPAAALLIESESRNTRENALLTKRLLDEHGIGRVLLVTSAAHMARALATFRRAGVDAVPSATDHHVAQGEPRTLLSWLPNAGALAMTTAAVKEYVGTWVYRSRDWL